MNVMSYISSKIKNNVFIIIIATISFLAIISINQFLFPYYSNNHDEGVYIFQAKMLAEGNIYLKTNDYSNFFDMWFIINDGEKIYSKYSPLHSLILSFFYVLFGNMRLAIGIISCVSLIFVYLITKEIYDIDTAKLASVICLSSPLFLLISGTYLSYTSSFLLSAIFIYFFIRSLKDLNNDNKKYTLISGMALGILFFDRPYDAILVGSPFMIYLFYKAITEKKRYITIKLGITILSFLPIFLITLSYNYILTGDPLLFPFNKYEPLDTLGFGIKRMSSYSPVYLFTPELSIDATKIFLSQLLFNWTSAGIFFIGFILIKIFRKRLFELSVYETLLLMLFASIILGNLMFWGLFHFSRWKEALEIYGPTYYFGLLLPISVISGKLVGYISESIRYNSRTVKLAILILIVFANIFLIIPKIDINYKYTEKNEKLYDPIVKSGMSNSLIFIPTIYGPYLQHPFGFLINDPSFNGPIVYAKDLGNRNIQLMKKYKDRDYYMFDYDGIYTESYDDNLTCKLTKLELLENQGIKINTSIRNPTDYKFVVTYVWNNGNTNYYILDNNSERDKYYNTTWHLTSNDIMLEGDYVQGLFKLSDDGPLIIGSAFSYSSSFGDAKEVYEHRYMFDIDNDNVTLSIPAEGWKNKEYPESDWIRTDITGILSTNYNYVIKDIKGGKV